MSKDAESPNTCIICSL